MVSVSVTVDVKHKDLYLSSPITAWSLKEEHYLKDKVNVLEIRKPVLIGTDEAIKSTLIAVYVPEAQKTAGN